MAKLLADKVALITGAGSEKGMGFASARKLAAEGAKVIVTDIAGKDGRNLEHLRERAESINQDGGEAHAIPLDVTNPAQIKDAISQSVKLLGGIDILFSNAGVGRTGAFLEMSEEDWDFSYQVNQKGMVNVCREVIPSMISRGGGSLILNSSMSGLSGIADYSAYTMTKFAVIGLMKCLADEFGKHNIRCNAVCPGNIATDMGLNEVTERATYLGVSVDEARKRLENECALGRMGEPEDIANVVLFLASPLSSFVSGVSMPVAGAMYSGV